MASDVRVQTLFTGLIVLAWMSIWIFHNLVTVVRRVTSTCSRTPPTPGTRRWWSASCTAAGWSTLAVSRSRTAYWGLVTPRPSCPWTSGTGLMVLMTFGTRVLNLENIVDRPCPWDPGCVEPFFWQLRGLLVSSNDNMWVYLISTLLSRWRCLSLVNQCQLSEVEWSLVWLWQD